MSLLDTYAINENSHVPKYFQLKEILGKILRTLRPGDIIPSEHQLAEHFKLHRLTARQAISELVSEGLLYRIHGSGTFVSESDTQTTSNTIGCIFRGIRPRTASDNFFLEIFEAFEAELSVKNHFMLYKSLNNIDPKDIYSAILEIIATNPGGLVLDERVPDSVVEKLKSLNIPVILLNRQSPVTSIKSVIPDNESAITLALKYVRKQGHRKILFIYETASQNQKEMADELEKRSPYSNELVIIPATETDFSGKSYRDAVKKGLKLHKPTAIITGFDWIAKNAYDVIEKHSLRIPDDISVISIGGFDLAANLNPPLTTVKIDTRQIGRTAARAVLNTEEYPETIKIPGYLEERKSCTKLH